MHGPASKPLSREGEPAICLWLQHVEEMEGSKFAKLCRDSKLLSKTFTANDIDLYFAKATPNTNALMQ